MLINARPIHLFWRNTHSRLRMGHEIPLQDLSAYQPLIP